MTDRCRPTSDLRDALIHDIRAALNDATASMIAYDSAVVAADAVVALLARWECEEPK